MKKYNIYCFKLKTRFALGLMLFLLVYGVSLTKAQDLNQEDSLKRNPSK
jgi:CHASE3 domain sensor protein